MMMIMMMMMMMMMMMNLRITNIFNTTTTTTTKPIQRQVWYKSFEVERRTAESINSFPSQVLSVSKLVECCTKM